MKFAYVSSCEECKNVCGGDNYDCRSQIWLHGLPTIKCMCREFSSCDTDECEKSCCGSNSACYSDTVNGRYPNPKIKNLFEYGGTQHRLQK